ncbi:MAG TPA: hypothetical protein VHZ54_06180 [Solirubrobacterales bacterium]|jgi:hypothetical protein|nr:hypothetical protein [Solirubrobacterales bacterium]
MRLSAPLAALLCAALVVAGCGGGGSSGGSGSTAPSQGAAAKEDAGAPKKATAPNVPAGSKVVACEESAGAVEGLRATAVDCGTADRIMRRWEKHRSCALAGSASRGSCSLGGFRCQAVRASRGLAVSCARPGGDIAFLVKDPAG